MAAAQTTENCRRGTSFPRAIVTSLYCLVLSSSSSLLPSHLCSSPNPNSHSFPMSNLSSFLLTFYLKCLTEIQLSTKTGPSLGVPPWKGTYFSPNSMIVFIFPMSTNIKLGSFEFREPFSERSVFSQGELPLFSTQYWPCEWTDPGQKRWIASNCPVRQPDWLPGMYSVTGRALGLMCFSSIC